MAASVKVMKILGNPAARTASRNGSHIIVPEPRAVNVESLAAADDLPDMVHIRIGEGWKEDPRVRSALRSAADASARGQALRGNVDAVAIEVDGVDIAAGRAEG